VSRPGNHLAEWVGGETGRNTVTSTKNATATDRDNARPLADLVTVCGLLSEIATTWRRAWGVRPELPLDLPGRLQDTARQLAADIQELSSPGLGPDSEQAHSVRARLSAFRDDIASAQAMTCGQGVPSAGDTALWEDLRAALDRVGDRLAGLTDR